MMKRVSGFTLIELLIVVAIIAILAAIAVPNFLEAQVRSKVSRVKADQRSLATAIESYYVDNNSYPAWDSSSTGHYGADKSKLKDISQTSGIQNTPTFRIKGIDSASGANLMTLTTPVAYITSLFPDPFADSKPASFRYSGKKTTTGWLVWSFGPDTDEVGSTSSKCGDTDLDGGNPVTVADTIYNPANSVPSVNMINVTYDPTNGTTSNGDVYRIKQ